MKNILNRGFSHLNIDALVTKVNFIIAQLTGNTAFPTTNPTLVIVSGALKALTDGMALADPQARASAVASARVDLEQVLENLADNLENTSSNDPVALATTGFDMRKDTAQSGDAPAFPQNVRIKSTGITGEVGLLFDASDRAKGYQVQTSPDPNGPWTDYDTFSSSRGITMKGFPRAKDLWVRVRALGPNNTKSAWSDPATTLVS